MFVLVQPLMIFDTDIKAHDILYTLNSFIVIYWPKNFAKNGIFP